MCGRSLEGFCAALLVLALSSGCSSDSGTDPATAVAISPSSTTALNGVVGTAASPTPSVQVTGSDGQPFAGTSVSFSAGGGGSVAQSSATTDASGTASAGSWTLGTAAGAQTLTATASGLGSVTFRATAVAGSPTSLAIQSGNGQSGIVGGVAQPVSVRVADQYSNPVSGATVSFAVTGGGGQIVGGSAVTDAQGIATTAGWVFGSAPGTNSLSASVGGQSQAFTATTTAGAAAGLAVSSGNGQSGEVGAPLGSVLSVRTVDQFGNPVANVPVAFSVTAGSGTVSPTSASSDGQGLASTSLTLTGIGVATVTATSAAISGASAVFSASTGPTIAGTVSFVSDATRVALAIPSGGAMAFGKAHGGSKKTRADLAPQSGLSAEEASRRIAPTRRLIVSFKPESFDLPRSAQAYLSESVRQRATAAFYSALESAEISGLIRRAEVSPAIAAVRVEVADGHDMDDVAALLRRDARVLDVERDGVMYAHDARPPVFGFTGWPGLAGTWGASVAMAPSAFGAALATAPPTEMYPSDPFFDLQMWHYRMIDLPRAWKMTTGSNSVRVAIVDAGIRPDHPAVAPLLAATGHYDFTDGVTVAYSFPQPICGTAQTFLTIRGTAADVAAPRNMAQAPNDLILVGSAPTCWTRSTGGSHGTHVAGTVGSPANDGVGGVGVNWQVELISVRALGITGSGFNFDVAQGILYAGGLPATFTGAAPGFTVQMPAANVMNLSIGGGASTVVANAVSAASLNTLIIASAGNSRSSAPSYPGAYAEAVSVVALDPSYGLSSYTNIGTTVDIAAPGGETTRLWSSAGVLSSTWNYQTATANYSFYQGTSMSAPHVTGVAALVLAANPGLTPTQVRSRLLNGAIDLGAPGFDNSFGAGLVNAYNSVTGTRGPAANTHVRAINATTGAVAKTTMTSPNGGFTLANLDPGSYFVMAGQDEGTDPELGVPGRRLGWAGGGAMTPVTPDATTVTSLGMAIGTPLEVEPNDSNGQANALAVNSWVTGNILAPDPRDVYSVRIAVAGTYTFETSGVIGSCFAALELDTVLRLMDSNGTTLSTDDDTAYPIASYPGTFCSRISMQLQPGLYYVEVTPSGTDFGRYRLHIRQGQ